MEGQEVRSTEHLGPGSLEGTIQLMGMQLGDGVG